MNSVRDRTVHGLRQALEVAAEQVPPVDRSFDSVLGEWQRRERRRRLVLTLLVWAALVLCATVGLWVLGRHAAHRAS
ncbi:hypothetical protein ABZ569_12605 [Streptomyces albus]|uniref:hypothetical protein n=1 Tax=Streptomyces albus TaxID=1888 RepID=UPI00340EA7D9